MAAMSAEDELALHDIGKMATPALAVNHAPSAGSRLSLTLLAAILLKFLTP
jgi:hypothetical protein